MKVVISILLLVVVVLAVVIGWINIRARRLDHKDGSFRCWMRPDLQSGWTSGIAQYHTESLSWSRLVGMRFTPDLVMRRRSMTVSAPVQHASDGSMVEIRVVSGEQRCLFGISPQSYNGLVAWVESGPPQSRS